MSILVTDYSALTDDLQDIFSETARNAISESVGTTVFEVKETDRRTFDHLILHGLAGIQRVTPGQDLPRVTSEQGDTITYTQRYYGAIAAVTKEMRKFDLHDQIEGTIRSITQDGFDKIDQSYADVLLNFANTSYTDVWGESVTSTGPDGVALGVTNHSNNLNSTTFSNLINDGTNNNPALTRTAMVAERARALKFTDPNGLMRPVNLNTLLIGPKNEDLAKRILMSPQMSGTQNNDINPLKGKLTIKVWPRLDLRSDGTDTSNYWFMYDSKNIGETLKAKFSERPSLDAPEQVYSNKDWEYSIDFFYVVGLGYAPYVRCSSGVN